MNRTVDAAWYTILNVAELDSPSLVIYPERVKANIHMAKSLVRDISLLRPHVKTHKSADATRLQLAEGITKFKCATIAEAEMLAREGAPDVLLAYQPVGPKIPRLRALTRRYPDTTFSCLVDDMGTAHAIAETFAGEPEALAVFIDLNVGMNRTGIRPGEPALALYRACAAMTGIRPVGLHAYDGHIADMDPEVRAQRCREAFAPVAAMRGELDRITRAAHSWVRGGGKTSRLNGGNAPRHAPGAGTLPASGDTSAPLLVAGGSPTFPMHARHAEAECSPGTFIYWDKSYRDGLPDQKFLPAALVITRVMSQPSADTLCLDLGHKSVGAEKDILHRVFFVNAPDVEVLSQSEEHLLVKTGGTGRYSIGDVFYGLPYHICPTCALYDRAATVVDHKADGEWTMPARNRMITV